MPGWASGASAAAASTMVAIQKRGVPGSSSVEPKNEYANARTGAAIATTNTNETTGSAAKPAAQNTADIGPAGCAVASATIGGPAAAARC